MSTKTQEFPPTYVHHIPTRRAKKPSIAGWMGKQHHGSYSGSTGQVSPPASCRDFTKLGRERYIDFPEYVRRNNCIKAFYTACKVRAGDRARPVNPDMFRKYGICIIRGVDQSWDEFVGMEKDETKVEWPENNIPLIVHAQPTVQGEAPIITSATFFRPLFIGESETPPAA